MDTSGLFITKQERQTHGQKLSLNHSYYVIRLNSGLRSIKETMSHFTEYQSGRQQQRK